MSNKNPVSYQMSVLISLASLLPSWLTSIVLPLEPPTIESTLATETQTSDPVVTSTISDDSIPEIFARELKDVDNLEALRTLIQSLGIALHQKKEYVRQPLQHMLEKEWQLELIQTFLFDPFFENGASQKWREMYMYLSKISVAQERLHALLGFSVEAIRLGLVSPREIKSLLRLMPRIRTADAILGNLPAISEWYHKILDAISASPVVSLASLGTRSKRWLVKGSINAPYWEHAPLLLWGICPKNPSSTISFSNSLEKWLQMRLVDAPNGDISLPLKAVMEFFTRLNDGDLLKGAIDASTFLISHATSVPAGEQHVEAWIQQLRKVKLTLVISRSSIERSYIGSTYGVGNHLFRASKQQAILIRLWTLQKLGVTDLEALGSAVRSFWDELNQTSSPASLPLCDLIASIQSLGLVNNETNLLLTICLRHLPSPEAGLVPLPKMVAETQIEETSSRISRVSFDQLQGFAKSKMLSMSPIFAFVDNENWWYLSGNLQPILRHVSESLNENFDMFIRTGRFLIFQEPFASLMIMRILRFNIPFKMALSMSRVHVDSGLPRGSGLITRAQAALGKQKGWENERRSRSLYGSEDDVEGSHFIRGAPNSGYKSPRDSSKKFTLTPGGALEAMEILAAAFAVTTVLSPRQAFRRVWQCYYILKRYKAPLRPVITRCLWHAGVKRYGQRGCSKTQLRWITQQIAQVEGREVAEALIMNRYSSSVDPTFWEEAQIGDDSLVVDHDVLTEARSWVAMDEAEAVVDHCSEGRHARGAMQTVSGRDD